MTSFETTVLLVCSLLAVTNTAGLTYHPQLKNMPTWYVACLLALVLVTAISLLNTAYGAI